MPALHRPSRSRFPAERAGTALRAIARAGVAALLLGACGGDDGATDPGASPTVVIGIGARPDGPGYDQVVRGARLAVARLAEDAGDRLRFALREPRDSLASAVRLAATLRDDPAVLAVVGHPESGDTEAAIPVYADVDGRGRRAMPVVSPTATSPALSGASPWFFRVAPSDADVARRVARYVLDTLADSAAAVVYRNDAYGRDWSHAFGAAFTEAGGRVVLADPYLAEVTDWDLTAAHLALRGADVVLFPGDAPDAAALLRALGRRGVTLRFVGGDGTSALAAEPRFAGAHYLTIRSDSATGAEAARFLAAWHDAHDTPPDLFATLAYDATLAIGRAALAVHAGGAAPTRTRIRDALASLRLDGAAGPLTFDAATHDARGRTLTVATVPR